MMKHLSKMVMVAMVMLATKGLTATSSVYWKTWNVLPTVYDYNTAENWAYSNWGTAYLPGTNDIAYF